MRRFLSSFVDHSFAWVFSPRCLSCDRYSEEKSFCSDCSPFQLINSVICQTCGYGLSQPMQTCVECPEGIVRARSLFWMNDCAKSILHRVKFAYEEEYLGLFKNSIQSLVIPFTPIQTVLIPVPLSDQKRWVRGFNQSEILAGWLGKSLKLPVLWDGLLKTVETVQQSTLSRKEREKNLKNSFSWNPKREIPKNVLLIDDVFTTGATLKACARALKGAQIYVWTLFRTPNWQSVARRT